jgi:hypothetical protein
MIADILHKIKEFEIEETRPYSPRPSLSGPMRCVRSLDYYAQGYDRKPFPGRFMVVLEDSSLHEILIQDLINRSAFTLHSSQMEVHCGIVHCPDKKMWQVKGHIDGIMTDPLGKDYLLEIKALSHFGFIDIWKGELPLDYIVQTCLYARGLHDINPDIEQALLLIKNKNQGQFCEIGLTYSFQSDTVLITEMILSTGERKAINQTIENICSDALKRFEEVEQYKLEKKVHDRQYDKDHWRCQFCQYGEICYENYEEEFNERLEEGTLPEDFIDNLRYYLELNGHISEMEKEKDQIRDQVLEELKKQNAKLARLGEYTVTVRLQSRTSIDKEAPPELLKRCTKQTFNEVLTIRKPKTK